METFEGVLNYYVRRRNWMTEAQKEAGMRALSVIQEILGPPIEGYPSWHPLVSTYGNPSDEFRSDPIHLYRGLDHTQYFVNGFLTCPYGSGDEVMDAVAIRSMVGHPCATITAEKLKVKLYEPDTTAILVSCKWDFGKLCEDKTIPASTIAPLMLLGEVPHFLTASVGETWSSMLPNILGMPHEKLSSPFVNRESAMKLKKLWETVINTGMFGPIHA